MRSIQKSRGYVLIVAILILVAISSIGFVFIGVVGRNITGASQERRRSVVRDVALAGIRYAHSQLLYSELGADWRGAETPPSSTQDPDYDYLKPAGPDGNGFYTRLTFQNGRALVRVRYAPSDATVFQTVPAGPLRQPGVLRNYLIIEAVGRSGRIIPNDPTATGANTRTETQRMIAFASIGIIESARYITAKTRTSRPAEIGSPVELGARYGLDAVSVPVDLGQATTYNTQTVELGGSIYSNADLLVHGNVNVVLNKGLGDAILVAGTIGGADDNATLSLTRRDLDNSVTAGDLVNEPLTNGAGLNSRDSGFRTLQGVLRDGFPQIDREGFPRGVPRKDPPSILAADPSTGLNRYITMTRDSGAILATGNTGRFGHGRNVYVNNLADRQTRQSEEARVDVGSSESLIYDWLNPNNGQANSGWKGPFYVPPGAFLELTYDGFTITRDVRGPVSERTWRTEIGDDSGMSTIRYRIGEVDSDGAGPEPARNYIVNTLTPNIDIDANLVEADYAEGFPFDGVLYFEGNVRVRGRIADNVQLTVVSMGTIYVEGSITKGERSMAMLMAKDYVALNTTQFVGTALGQNLEEVSDIESSVSWNPIRMKAANGTLNLRSEFVRDPDVDELFASTYREFTSPGATNGPVIDTELLLTHTMDDGAASNAFFSLDVNFGLGTTPTYQFALDSYVNPAPHDYRNPSVNSATPYYGGTHAPIYGLGDESWQRSPKFESQGFPMVQSNFTNVDPELDAVAPVGSYTLLMDESNYFNFRSNNVGPGSTNDYLLARAALIPHDVLIEASMFAEDGSFFVIPGPWFNPDANDRRDRYSLLGATPAERALNRRENYGAFASMPFYGEPPDIRVRIIGAISENMPPPISQQAEWIRKWGWIPKELGSTGRLIPWQHVPDGYDPSGSTLAVPNLIVSYDLDLATAKADGFGGTTYIRTDSMDRPLPPMPRLPVSPTLAYFGELNR